MTFLHAIILSIVEGLTEFLPISSTGHLILASKLLQVPQTEFLKSFQIFIQLGAILAVVVLYWTTIQHGTRVWKKIFLSFIPTAIAGLLLYDFIKSYLIGNETVTVISLFTGGIILIILELLFKENKQQTNTIPDITAGNAIIIGIAQSISIIPGVSRAAATIIGARLLGVGRETAVEYSFLLAIPTMAAATGIDLIKSSYSFTGQEYLMLAVGFSSSFLVALGAIKFLLKFIQSHTFIPFGIYRIILAVAYWMFH